MGKHDKGSVVSGRLWFIASVVVGAAACLFTGFLVGQYLIQAVTSSVQEPEVAFEDKILSEEVRKAIEKGEGEVIRQAEEARSQAPDSGTMLFRVQVGAFSTRGNAEKLAEKLRSEGYTPIIVEDGLHRVQLGAFSSRENADKLLAELTKRGYEGVVIH